MKIQLRNKRGGFTLIEIMVVVVILGVLAATIIPQFMGTTHDAKVGAAKAHVSELEAAVERFNIHMDRCLQRRRRRSRRSWKGPGARRGHGEGRISSNCARIRGDNPAGSRVPGTHHPTSFDLWSRGGDGADGGEGEGTDIGNW